MSKELDAIGKLIMERLRDSGFSFADGLVSGHWKAPRLGGLQSDLAAADDECRELAVRCTRVAIDHAVHDFLFALHEACEAGEISVSMGGKDVEELSDGLQGELFTEDGWQARFSRYGERPDEA